MLVDAVERAEAAVAEMLALARNGAAATPDVRFGLERTKPILSMLTAFQAAAAAAIAASERHGDSGAGVLRHATGLSRRQAESQVKASETIESMPAVRGALATGTVSFANASRLAQAAEKAGIDAVQSDRVLMSNAESMPEDQFAREARRWIAQHQPDQGEAEHESRRQKRSVRMWDGNDGMTHLKAELDPVTGERIRNRLEAEARRMYKADKKSAKTGGATRRTFQQCMADALDRTTATSTAAAGGRAGGRGNAPHPLADIAVVAHLDEETSRIVAQLANGEPLSRPVFEQLMCQSAITPLLYGSNGVPLWRGVTKRSATAAQHQALVSRDGGCSGCRANPALCEDHHVRPVSEGGPTDISNMTLLCWDCHQKVHHHDWQVVPRGDGRFKVKPPERIRHGPARVGEVSRSGGAGGVRERSGVAGAGGVPERSGGAGGVRERSGVAGSGGVRERSGVAGSGCAPERLSAGGAGGALAATDGLAVGGAPRARLSLFEWPSGGAS